MIVRSKSSKPTENSVEKDVIEFMQTRSWRATRNHVGTFRTLYGGWVKIGEEGFPDWTFTRGSTYCQGCAIMHWEAKKPGEKPTPIQMQKIASLNAIGELAFWASSLLQFKQTYSLYFSD
jgi:hypothetical protein